VETKRCSGDDAFSCGQEKPVSEFYEKRPGQYQSLCKACFNARRKARYAVSPDAEKKQATEWQRENRDKTKTYQARSRAKNRASVIATSRTYEAKPETKVARRKYDEEHRDESRAYNVQYREGHKEEVRRYAAGYRAGRRVELRESQRRWREEHPESNKTIHKKWKSNNKDKVNTATNNRRARIKGLEGSYTLAELQALYDQYDRTCLWCRNREPEITLSPDHVIPVTVEGATNWISNIQPLCAGPKGCNYRKGDRTFDLRPYWPGPLPEYVELPDGSLFYLSTSSGM
jgi:hypothetical protein